LPVWTTETTLAPLSATDKGSVQAVSAPSIKTALTGRNAGNPVT
jgi:hypothetical protein